MDAVPRFAKSLLRALRVSCFSVSSFSLSHVYVARLFRPSPHVPVFLTLFENLFSFVTFV